MSRSAFLVIVPLILAPLMFAVCASTASAQTPPHFVEITVPLATTGLNPAFRTSIATYEWQTDSGSPDPAEVRWIMVPASEHNGSLSETEDYVRTNPDAPEWSAWYPYAPPSTGTSWTSPPMELGLYVFAVEGKDAAGNTDGDFTLDRNLRRVVVNTRSTGPLLKVTGEYIDDILTAVTQTLVTDIALAAGTPVSFCWEATGEWYGLPVTGYRYGWDLSDPDDDGSWPMPFTPFAQPVECSADRSFTSGVHVFYVEVIDYDGFKSRVPIRVTITGAVPVELTTWGRIKSLYTP
jgi:hypothetical protein